MQKVIEGKRYDTRTAVEIGSREYLNRTDFQYVSETLYRKKTGEYFLAGEGGAMTDYAVQTATGGWTGGEKIFPLTLDAAKAWVEKHMSAEAYMEEFGDPDTEDDYDTALMIFVPAWLHKRLKQKQSETGKTMKQIVTDILSEALCND